MRLNPAQRDAAFDVDRHVLVSAGAGTGKTHCVVARLLYLLGEPVEGRRIAPEQRAGLDRLAAITFTNAAAADLQRKLRQGLQVAGRREEAARVDTARIGTIHAFCGRLLWEFALQLDRVPGLTALDEAEAVALSAEGAHDALIEALESGGNPDLGALLDEYRVDDVLAFTARLASDADRLARIRRETGLDRRERALAELGERALALMARRLGEREAVDFDSMVVLARNLLRDRPDVRRVLHRRIHTLIVDEFQDVDPVQQEIAWLLAEPGSGRTDTPRLMLVGDPKQSIYRFRRSDVTIWTRVEREFREGQGAVHVLSENFRSRRPILAFVDAVLAPELNTPVSGAAHADYEVGFQPLDPAAGNRGKEPCVELLVLPSLPNGKAAQGDAARRLEIPAVASHLRRLVEDGTAPGDVAILLSAWAPAEAFHDALAARGIASWMLRNEGFYERREVVDCLIGLRAIRDPYDDLALFGFLRSPMVGVKDETLLAIARHGGPPYWRHLDQAETGEPELVRFGAAALRRLNALCDRCAPGELLGELLGETTYLAHLALLGDDGRQADANVRKLLRLLDRWRHLTVAEVLRLVDEMRDREEGALEGDAPLEARRDAVTITTIHSAKGLEWPVVVWADLSRGPAPLDWRFLVGRSTMRLRSAGFEKWQDDVRFADLRRAEELEEQAQRKRLWYVAATRARDRLVLSGIPLGERGRRHAGTAAAAALRLGSLNGPTVTYRDYRGEAFEAAVIVAEVPEGPAAPVEGAREPGPVLPAETLEVAWAPVALPAGRVRHSASELVTFGRCRRKHWFIYRAGLREPPVDRGSAEFLDAVTRGHIVHDVLEHLRELDELDALLEDAIGRWDPDSPPPEAAEGGRYRGRLRGEIERVATHADYRAVADLPGARRELGFVHLAGAGRVMQGKVDLVGERDGKLVLLDVKTGSVATREHAARRAEGYAAQRQVYVRAAEAISGKEVAEFRFHFSGADQSVAMPVTAPVRDGGARSVDEALGAIEAGDRAMTATKAECWWCGFRRAGWCEGVGRG